MVGNVNVIRSLLAQGMAGVAKANAAQQAVQEGRTGAYTLFVDAAILAGDVKPLSEVADALFAEIRVSSTVTDAEGVSYPVNAKADKDGKGFTIPSSFSTARSILCDALVRGIPLTEDGSERSYTAIRKDVKAAKDAEDRAKATGDEKVRMDTLDMLATLLEAAKDAKGPVLADLYRRVRKAANPVTVQAAPKPEAQAEAQAQALANAA